EAGHRDQDDARIQRSEPVIVEAHRLHDAGTVVFENDARFLDALPKQLFPFGVAQVDAHAFLAPVVDAEVHALTADERRMLACLLTTRALDLDHFGPEVAEDHPTTRAGLKARELQDPDAVEREAHRELRPSRTPAAS